MRVVLDVFSMMVASLVAGLGIGALLLGLGACTATQVSTTQADVTVVCAAAQKLDGAASAKVQDDLATACADEQVIAPVVAPLIPAPAAQ